MVLKYRSPLAFFHGAEQKFEEVGKAGRFGDVEM
jgi:hypothetical protein